MDDQNTEARMVLRYGEMIEGQDGLYRLGEVNVFHWNAEQNSGAAGESLLPEESVAAWVEWMSADQTCLVVELPLTARTRAWGCGLVFSVTPMGGGESQVYAVMLGGEWMQCNGLRGDWGGRG